MTNTPDEIKKGLECCCDLMGVMCPYCPYAEDGDASETCREEMAGDSLALIQQLEKRVIHLEALNQSDLTTITMQERTRARFQERISQLESDKQQLEGMLAHMNQLRDAAAGRALEMEERVHQLEAERDAMMQDMNRSCFICKHFDTGIGRLNAVCAECERWCNWEWHGVQKEE